MAVLAFAQLLKGRKSLVVALLVPLDDILLTLHEGVGFQQGAIEEHGVEVVAQPRGASDDDGRRVVEVVQLELVRRVRGGAEDVRVLVEEGVVLRQPRGVGVREGLPDEADVLVQQVLIPPIGIDNGQRKVSQPVGGDRQVLVVRRALAGDILAQVQQLDGVEDALLSLLDERVDLLGGGQSDRPRSGSIRPRGSGEVVFDIPFDGLKKTIIVDGTPPAGCTYLLPCARAEALLTLPPYPHLYTLMLPNARET